MQPGGSIVVQTYWARQTGAKIAGKARAARERTQVFISPKICRDFPRWQPASSRLKPLPEVARPDAHRPETEVGLQFVGRRLDPAASDHDQAAEFVIERGRATVPRNSFSTCTRSLAGPGGCLRG